MKTIMLTLLTLLTITFTACDPVVEPESEFKTSGMSAIAGRWKLVEPASAYSVYLEITPDSVQGSVSPTKFRLNGKSAVNLYSGVLELTGGDKLTLSALGSTKMAGPQEAMQFELAYFNKLQAVSRYEQSGNQLILFSGTSRLVYERQALDKALLGRWKWVKVTYGFSQVVSTPDKVGYTETLEFYADGTYKRFRNDKAVEMQLVYSGNNPTQTMYKQAIFFPAVREAQPYEIKDSRLFLYERGPAEVTIADGGIYEYEKVN